MSQKSPVTNAVIEVSWRVSQGGFESWLWPFRSKCSWLSYFPSLSLNSLICIMGMIIIFHSCNDVRSSPQGTLPWPPINKSRWCLLSSSFRSVFHIRQPEITVCPAKYSQRVLHYRKNTAIGPLFQCSNTCWWSWEMTTPGSALCAIVAYQLRNYPTAAR